MSYEDLKYRRVSIHWLVLFILLTFACITTREDYLVNIFYKVEVNIVSIFVIFIQLLLRNIMLPDFVFFFLTFLLIKEDAMQATLLMGFLPLFSVLTLRSYATLLNTYTSLIRLGLFLRLREKLGVKSIFIIILPFSWLFLPLFVTGIKDYKLEVPFIPIFCMVVLITSCLHIILL